MQGNQEVIDRLNGRLAEELRSINQYFVQAEMCDDWGYEVLHKMIRARSISEMKHAESLIERIIYLDGRPIVSKLDEIRVGENVPEFHRNDHVTETEAIVNYNTDINFARSVNDSGTADLLESILEDEEEHIDWIETQFDLMEQLGLENYLSEQTGYEE